MGLCLIRALRTVFSLEELKTGLFGPRRGGELSRKPLLNTSVGKMLFLLAFSSSFLYLLLGKC